MPPSVPHIPDNLLQKILSDPKLGGNDSLIFDRPWTAHRAEIVGNPQGVSDVPIHIPGTGNGGYPWTQEKRRTWLHFAAAKGDVLLAYEIIRLGATVDVEDCERSTPLLTGLRHLGDFNKLVILNRTMPQSRPRGTPTAAQAQSMMHRIKCVTQILVEQHANVNISRGGSTPLSLACAVPEWDIITLLLQHGTNPMLSTAARPPATSPLGQLRSDADRARFRELASSTYVAGRRPIRLCPCWSGQALIDCHAAEKNPYPKEFICTCGSGKAYGKCCARRNIEIAEEWDNKEKKIESYRKKLYQGPPTDLVGMLAQAKAAGINTRNGSMKRLASELRFQGKIDVAFAYALSRSSVCPTPRGRNESKTRCKEFQTDWNALVDQYIADQNDDRSRIEIERVAKLGIALGPLYRTCEGPGCTKMEGRDVPSLSCCSQCKMSVYCSRACQTSAWKEGGHKQECGSLGQKEQMLPSQRAVMEVMNSLS